eukprot:6618233-Pyramimonas_sp.AAC.1
MRRRRRLSRRKRRRRSPRSRVLFWDSGQKRREGGESLGQGGGERGSAQISTEPTWFAEEGFGTSSEWRRGQLVAARRGASEVGGDGAPFHTLPHTTFWPPLEARACGRARAPTPVCASAAHTHVIIKSVAWTESGSPSTVGGGIDRALAESVR